MRVRVSRKDEAHDAEPLPDLQERGGFTAKVRHPNADLALIREYGFTPDCLHVRRGALR